MANDVEEVRQIMANSFMQIGRDLDKLNRQARDASGPGGGIGRLDMTLVGMAKGMLGPAGLAAGLWQLSSALGDVAQKSVQMTGFARNMSLSTNQVEDFQKQLRYMGQSNEQALSTLGNVTSKLDGLLTRGRSSDLYQSFLPSEGGAQFMERVYALERAGKRMEALREIQRTYRAQNTEAARNEIANNFALTKAELENDQLFAAGKEKAYQVNEAAMARYHKSSVDFSSKVSDVWKVLSGTVIENMDKMTGGAESSGKGMEKVLSGIEWAVNGTFRQLNRELETLKAMYEWFTAPGLLERATLKVQGIEPLEKVTNEQRMQAMRNYPQAEDPMGADYQQKARHQEGYWGWSQYWTGQYPNNNEFGRRGVQRLRDSGGTNPNGITDFGGMRRRDESIQEQQTNILEEIRDTLQGKTGRTGESGGGDPGGVSTGGGRGGLARALGMNSDVGGSRSGGTRGDRNNNPGNMKFGPFAKSQGATGADDRGFAIFPDKETGEAAHKALVTSDRYKGLTLDQFGDKYSEGSESWKNTVGKALGIGRGDIVDNQNPALLDAIKRAEGTGRGQRANAPGYTGNSGDGLPSAVLDEARRVAAREGNGESVQNYIRSQGYNVNSAWCGDFAASVVRASGGTPPKGHSIASNWRNYGTQVDSPQPGDIAVRRTSRFGGGGYVPTGATGSHVTIVDQVGEDGRFVGLGGNQSRRRSNFPSSQFDFFRGTDEARARMDAQAKKQSDAASARGSINATVDFKNVPPGVKTSADTDGEVFDKLQINKSKTGEVAGGTPGQPYSGVW